MKEWKAFDAAWYSRSGKSFATKEEAVEYAKTWNYVVDIHIDEEARTVTFRGRVLL